MGKRKPATECLDMHKELKNWQKLDSEHHLHPFTDHGELAEKGTRVITKGDGVYIWDAEGNQILDGMSGLWLSLIHI